MRLELFTPARFRHSVEDGKWFKAIITEVRDDSANQLNGKLYAPYRIHSIGFKDLGGHWVCCADFADRRSQLRTSGSGLTEPVPGGEAGEANDEVLKAMRGATAAVPAQPGSGGAVPAKQYHCVFFLVDHLENTAPPTITGNGTYSGGTYTFNPASSTLTFHGGDYDGQRATYEMDGAPKLHILGPSGRPVIDCD